MKSLIFFGVITLILLTATSCINELRARRDTLMSSEEWPTLYRFSQDDLWGFKDASGNIILEPQFIVASNFSEGLAFVRLPDTDEGTGFIDVNGNLVIPLPDIVQFVGGFSEGFAPIIIRKWNRATEFPHVMGPPGPAIFIDRTGQQVFGQEFQSADPFSGGFARVSPYRGRVFFIDRTGQNAFGKEFMFADSFVGEYAWVTLLDGTRTYIDRRGNIVAGGLRP